MGWISDLIGLSAGAVVYWAPRARPDRDGRIRYDDATEITARWEDRQELFANREGEQVVSNGFCFPTEDDLAVGGYLYQGSLSSLSVAEKRDPTIVDGAWEIQSWGKLPDIQLSDYLRTAIF
jgi:hypothetical protein